MNKKFSLLFFTCFICSSLLFSQNQTNDSLEGDLFLKVKISDQEVYLGQQVSIQVELFSTRDFTIQEVKESISDITEIDLAEAETIYDMYTEELEIDNKVYKTRLISRFIFYPIVEGVLNIAPIQYKVNLEPFVKGKAPVAISTPDTLKIKVNSLPADFQTDHHNAVDINKIEIWDMDLPGRNKGKSEYNIGVWIYGTGHPFFMLPPDLGLDGVADVRLDYSSISRRIKRGKERNRRVYNYKIAFYEKGLVEINPVIKSWNSKQGKWGNKFPEEPLKLSVEKISKDKKKRTSKKKKRKRKKKEVMVVMDVSPSMYTKDFAPSRLGFYAPQLDSFFLKNMKKQNVGVIGFAEKAHVFQALTADYNTLSEGLKKAATTFMKKGSGPGNAIMLALERLEKSNADEKVILLISDGENNSDYFSLKLAARIAAQNGVQLSIIGLGSKRKAMSPRNFYPDRKEFDYVEREAAIFYPGNLKALIPEGALYFEVSTQESFDLILEKALNYTKPVYTDDTSKVSEFIQSLLMENTRIIDQSSKKLITLY